MHHLIFIYIPKPIIYIVHTAAPNCHFRLLNVEEHKATYDNAGLDRYNSPGAGAFTPWFNRTSTAAKDIEAGSELYVDYGPSKYCLQLVYKNVTNTLVYDNIILIHFQFKSHSSNYSISS